MNATDLKTILDKHKKWLNNEEGGERADLRGANLRRADLDFSCWPLWCGSKNVKVDNRLVFQLAAHICVLDCDTPEFKAIKEFLIPYAKLCHRASELGLL